MKHRVGILAGTVLLLGLVYVVAFTDWLRAEPIRIQAQFRELPRDQAWRLQRNKAVKDKASAAASSVDKPRRGDPVFGAGPDFEGQYPVVFALDGEYPLTFIRVIEAGPTNHAPRIAWQANTASNSVPTRAVIYGHVPRGMKLKDEREPATKLEPGVLYRLELKAGRHSGNITFQAKEVAQPEAQ